MDERLEAGMHDILDGTATEEQARMVRIALASDDAARRRFRELTQLHETLNRAARYPAPSEIRPAVLRDIEGHHRRLPAPRPFSSSLWNALSRRPAVGMAWGFATGAMAVLLGLLFFRGTTPLPESITDSPDPNHFAGTLVRNDTGASAKLLSEGRLDLPGGVAVARVLQLENCLQVEISVNTVTGPCISLKHPSAERTLTRIIPDGSTSGRIDLAADGVDWYPPPAGRMTLEFSLGGLEEPFSLETTVDGATRRVTLATGSTSKGR